VVADGLQVRCVSRAQPIRRRLEALRSAGATEEIIAAALKAGGAFENAPPRKRGRSRKYYDDAARKRGGR